MRRRAALIIVLSSAWMTGSGERSLAGAPSRAVIKSWRHQHVLAYKDAMRPDRFETALAPARQYALLYPNHQLAAKTSELAGYSLSLQNRFAEAIKQYIQAKSLAEASGDKATAAVAVNALSNIYFASGNLNGALEAARQAVGTKLDIPNPAFQSALETHYARTLARSGRFDEARQVFTRVIALTGRANLPAQQADALKLFGRELMQRGEFEPAGRAMDEALRLRLSAHNPEIATYYYDLAELQLRAGRPAESLPLLALARLNLGASTRLPAWLLALLGGRVHMAMSDPARALVDLQIAVRGFDSSPAYRLPGDLLRSQVARPTAAHELFAEAALAEFNRNGDRELLSQAFAVTEAGRAAALRSATDAPPVPEKLAARYWNLVADLDAANAALLAQEEPAARRRIAQLRLALAELESGAADRTMAPARSLLDIPPPIAQVRAGEALISFQLGERVSVAWTIAGGQLAATRLPPREFVQQAIKLWLAAPAGGERTGLARRLYKILLGELPGPVQSARFWMIAADGDLFQAPLAALVAGFDGERPVYLAERHALQLVPGAWALDRRQPVSRNGLFLGIGDPIYNEGDPRGNAGYHWPWQSAAEAEGAAGLARLASSTAEVSACARYWPASRKLLGELASPQEFSRALNDAPAVVHLAIHVVPAPDRPSENLIALGAGSAGHPAYVGPEWIGAHRLPGSLVVMNGCRSGSGAITSGEGLMGLTRAWLRAGARQVVSTYWPTLDDGGKLPLAFYRELTATGVSTPVALQRAQLSMLRQEGWRSDPQYWAAYFLIGIPE